jgi:predicted nucleotidyltransferase
MPATPELLALRDVCAQLDGAGIAYMLTGSLAMSFYARPRMTRDIDLVVALESAKVERLTGALGTDYHADASAISVALRGGRPWNIIHVPSVVKIDLIPRKDTPYRRAEFERRRRVELAGVPLWIVSVEDLILSKLEWSRESHSEQQRRDVRLLLEAPLDRAYLDKWAARLDLQGLLKEVGNDRHQPGN